MKKSKLIPMTEEEEYRNAGITKEEISKLAEKKISKEEIKQGFNDVMEWAEKQGFIKVMLNDNGEKIVKLLISEERIKEEMMKAEREMKDE